MTTYSHQILRASSRELEVRGGTLQVQLKQLGQEGYRVVGVIPPQGNDPAHLVMEKTDP